MEIEVLPIISIHKHAAMIRQPKENHLLHYESIKLYLFSRLQRKSQEHGKKLAAECI